MIEENLALASYLADRVRSAPDLDLAAPPSLSVVCFRFVGDKDRDDEAIAALNRALLERLQLGGEAFLTSTELRGRFVLRACTSTTEAAARTSIGCWMRSER